MPAKCVVGILEFNWNQSFIEDKIKNLLSSAHNGKTGHFMSWKEREGQRNVQKTINACAKCGKLWFFVVKYANL